MLTFEEYRLRLERGLSFIEFNYQLLQAFDFYTLHQKYGTCLQIGGADQWGNITAGVDLIRRKLGGTTELTKEHQAFGLTFPLIMRADGKKMGKSEKGAIFLDPALTPVFEFFQYWRNVADADVLKCIRMLTFLPLEEIDKMDEWEGSQLNTAKEILAFELTKLVHGEEEAQKAADAALALFAGGTNGADVVHIHSVGGNVHLLAVDHNVAMQHQLTGLSAAHGEAQAVHHVVKTALQNGEEVLAGLAGTALSQLEVTTELALQNTVKSLCLLLLAQLLAVLGGLAAALAVLAGSIAAASDGALISVATVALQEELLALSAALAANCFSISCHIRLPPSITRDDAWEDGSHCEEWESRP